MIRLSPEPPLTSTVETEWDPTARPVYLEGLVPLTGRGGSNPPSDTDYLQK